MSQQWEPPGQQPWEQPDPRVASQPQPEPLDPTRQLPPTTGLPPHAAVPGTRPYDAGQFAPPPAFGYQPYPQYAPVPRYAGGPQVPQGPPVQSRTALAAALIQFVQCLGWAIFALVLMTTPPTRFVDPENLDPDFTLEDAKGALVAAAVVSLLGVAAMVTLGILTLRRVNGCRIASAIVQIVLGSLVLLGLLGGIGDDPDPGGVLLSLLDVIASATGATLLFLGSSAAYCRRGSPYAHPGGARPFGT